jgi:FMN phosphatase YigB (HAD superfamily)
MSDPAAAVLLDVGGTLWPDTWPSSGSDDAARVRRLMAALPALAAAEAASLLERLGSGMAGLDGALVQDTDAIVCSALQQGGIAADPQALAAVRGVMCIPAQSRIRLFPGAADLLERLHSLGLVTVVISNAFWRSNAHYRADFEALGVGHQIDAIVSSVDTGMRKPHPAIFEAAVAEAGCPARRCTMIGNSERNDILPALALGMRAIRVAIEEPPPPATAAHALVTSLGEELLRALGVH